jgi:hypothetical protein
VAWEAQQHQNGKPEGRMEAVSFDAFSLSKYLGWFGVILLGTAIAIPYLNEGCGADTWGY